MSKQTRRQFLRQAGAIGLSSAAFNPLAPLSVSAAGDTARKRKPNVVFAFSDQHRWQSLSFTEEPKVKTPNIAALAGEGVSFSQCISNYPVCSPCRAILLTGRWPYQTGVIDNDIPLSPNEQTLAKAFKAAGYRTGYIGKWHLGSERAEPFGFDHSLIWTETNAHWDKSRYHPAKGEPVQPKGYNATLMTDQALAFIDEHKTEPFFLALSWNPPHSNFLDAPEEEKALYPEGSVPRRPNVPDAPAANAKTQVDWKPNDWKTSQGYYGHVSAIDDELGRIARKLEELDLARDTILVYSSDHGDMGGSHGVGGKRQPYEESIRVPFVLRYPGVVPPGRKEDALFGAIDIPPTLLGLAGIERPASFEGKDFSPLLRGESFDAPKSQLIMHIAKEHASGGANHPAQLFRGVRTDRYTYVEFVDGGGLLFDNRTDPYQKTNLFSEPRLSATRETLRTELQDALRRAHDPLARPAAPS
ncbi:MAG: sulfatase [Candidatus Hydrogenedentes bacterium]|nr:sulfatase [Candidatus Hydrogenedentota bacterium]